MPETRRQEQDYAYLAHNHGTPFARGVFATYAAFALTSGAMKAAAGAWA